ncbi:MAG: biotin synthase BioB [Planctomycetaceae bacterium]|nr:biotin synthase BioB [Planctomycetaceae bacterium]|tara:strand:+ start:4564 stop:5616 length:1053 start_codon:yes stop_codon:yes gene_type:complete
MQHDTLCRTPGTESDVDWNEMADRVLSGDRLTTDEACVILDSPDSEVLDLLAATYRVRRNYFGRSVQLYYLMNAKSGLCPEDCSYCSQSKISKADIPTYNLLSERRLLDGAREAFERGSKTYCIVISAKGPSDREMRAVTTIVPKIKEAYDLKICACLGLLTDEQAGALKDCGVDRVNHNLNTSEEHYGNICSTHSYDDRIATLGAVRQAGLEICSGGIIGMGEKPLDVVRMAFSLRDLEAESIPINFLNPIDGTPLSGQWDLNPRYCLKVLCMFRMVNPEREIRIAGGREVHLGSLQPLALYAANSIFVGDYLTTKGQLPEADYQMIRELGFEVTRHEDPGVPLAESRS